MKGCAKNLFIGIGVIAVIIVIAAIASSGKKDSNSQTVTNPSATASQQAASATATPTPADTITITNSVFADQGYGTYKVDGEVKNNDSVKHSAILKATFYDASGKILGTATGALNDVAAGDTKTFTLVGTDKVAGYKSMKVQVDTLL